MIRTRRSLAIATSILRMVAACCCLLGVEADPVELGDAVDDVRRRRCRSVLDSATVMLGVLDRVVQQGGRDRDVVEAEVGDDLGHGQRVLDVGLAGVADLAAVGVARPSS